MDDTSKTHETGYYPKSMDELRFYLKHLVKKYKLSQPTEDDAVFNATNVNAIDRKKERHGYNSGEDRAVYESEKDEPKNPYAKDRAVHAKWRAIKDANQEKAKKRKEAKADIERAKKMNEEDNVVRFAGAGKKASKTTSGGDHPRYVMHGGAKHEVIRVHPLGSPVTKMDHKTGEHYNTGKKHEETHYVLRKVHVRRGESHSWPKKVPMSQTNPINEGVLSKLFGKKKPKGKPGAEGPNLDQKYTPVRNPDYDEHTRQQPPKDTSGITPVHDRAKLRKKNKEMKEDTERSLGDVLDVDLHEILDFRKMKNSGTGDKGGRTSDKDFHAATKDGKSMDVKDRPAPKVYAKDKN